MKSIPEEPSKLAVKIAIVDAKLVDLQNEIREIGLPAGQELLRRLDVLKIEEKALKRNFEESRLRGEPDTVRLQKIEALLDHIEREEASMENDAHFLHQSVPSSMGVAVEVGARMVELYRRAFRKVLGDHHLLGFSVFVNQTHENIAVGYGRNDPAKSSIPRDVVTRR
jgi:hypothetical protein